MRTLVFILAVIVFVLLGYLVFKSAVNRKTPAPVVVSADVGSDSIAAYRQRVVDLKGRADRLRAQLAVAGRDYKGAVQARLQMVDEQIHALEQAIGRWEVVVNPDEKAGAYRQCILYYGKASGVCDALAPDTLPGK
jgi:hypothetical protein